MQQVWRLDLNAASTPAEVGDVIALHTVDHNVAEIEGQRVVGINRIDGTILWTRKAGTMQSFFSPVTDGRLIYSTHAVTCSLRNCSSGYPMALNPADGSIVWTNEEVDNMGPAPVVVDGRLLFDDVSAFRDTGDGFNYGRGTASLDSATGSIQWVSIQGKSFYSLTAINDDGSVMRSSYEPTYAPER